MTTRRTTNSAFSLLELSMVLLIVALLAGSSIVAGVVQMDSAKVSQTNAKMAALEQALIVYRKSNGRLPCPASYTVPQTDFAFGTEAQNPGTCTGIQTYENFVAQGTVPVRSLSLPDDFMYDGWGQRITYAVNKTLTMENAFAASEVDEDCGMIEILDETGGTRTDNAAYVLLSHGKNGHGGYTDKGLRVSSGSNNPDELINCDCDNTATALASATRSFSLRSLGESPGASTDDFDDILTYKNRWQLITPQDSASKKTWPAQQPELVVGQSSGTPEPVAVYSRSCNQFTRLPAGQQPPAVLATDAEVSKDPVYIALNDSGTRIRVMKYFSENNSFAAITNIPDIAGLSLTTHIAISRDAKYIAAPHDNTGPTDHNVTLYKRNADSFVRLPISASGNTNDAVNANLSDDSIYLAVTEKAAPYVTVYKRYNEMFTALVPVIAGVSAQAWDAVFSHDNSYMAVVQNAATTVLVYKRDGDSFTKLPDIIAADQPTSVAVSAAFSDDNQYLAVGGAGFVTVYRRSGDTFIRLATPTTLGSISQVSFSRHGNFLAAAADGAGQAMKLWRRSGDSFIAIDPPAGLPGLFTDTATFIP